MSPERYAEVDRLLRRGALRTSIPLDWALQWCEAEQCGCLGCANGSGRLRENGVTKDEWQAWWHLTAAQINK